MRPNKTKAKLLAGEPVFGISPGIDHPDMVELLGYLGYDYVFLDCEHRSLTEESVCDVIRAAYATDITPLVRVPANVPHVIMRFLEQAPQGIIVPHVNSRDEAQAVVAAAKYPPLGNRGFGGLRAHEFRTRVSMKESIAQSNKETLIVIMIEEIKAIEHLPEILTVEGIDVFFFGPGDLSQSMGYTGELGHPAVLEVIDKAIAQTVGMGRIAATFVNIDNVRRYLDLGVRFLHTQILPYIISGGRRFLEVAKGE